jgi:Transcription factor WhiB
VIPLGDSHAMRALLARVDPTTRWPNVEKPCGEQTPVFDLTCEVASIAEQAAVEAKRVCHTGGEGDAPCPWLELCFAKAFSFGAKGVWGGTTEYERRTLKRRLGDKRRRSGPTRRTSPPERQIA